MIRAFLGGAALGGSVALAIYVVALVGAMILRAVLGLAAGPQHATVHVVPLVLATTACLVAPLVWKRLVPDVLEERWFAGRGPLDLLAVHLGLAAAALLAMAVTIPVWAAANPAVLAPPVGPAGAALYALDLTLQGAFLDVFEHFGLSLSGARATAASIPFLLVTFAYRTFATVLLLDVILTWRTQYRLAGTTPHPTKLP